MQRLHDAVLREPGALDLDTRLGIATRRALPPDLHAYAEKVAWRAYSVTDTDIAGLRAAGYSDDAIFEITVAVALGVGLLQRDAGLAALEGTS
jgi:alkylhydroperoxidase family enzyme